MRRALYATTLLLALGACSKAPVAEESGEQAAAPAAGPRVGVTPDAGLSITYSYGFRLPAQRIIAAQEEHAAQCEAMTPARCRITGMSYHVGRDRSIIAMLDLRLAPDQARGFGKRAAEAVVKRGGMLEDARIDSEETGAVAAQADRESAAVAAERARIEKQLAQPGLGSTERAQLQAQLATLSERAQDAADVRDAVARKLANTPVTLNYASGSVDPGLNDGPIWGAVKDGWANIVAGLAVIVMLVITAVPWVAAFVLLFWLWRRFGRRLLGLDRG